MKKYYILSATIFFFAACKVNSKQENSKFKELAASNSIKKMNFSELQPYLHIKDNKTYVVNFWATWCKPCVDELPVFETLNSDSKEKNIEILLVNVNNPEELESKVIPLIKEKNIKSTVVLFDEPNLEEKFIEIDQEWMGSLPGTLIYNKNKRQFFKHPVSIEELKKYLKEFKN